MKKATLILAVLIVFMSRLSMAAAPNDLVLQDQTIQNGQILEYYAYDSITVGPNYVMESGSDVTLRSSGTVILGPGFSAMSGSTLTVEIVAEPPNIAPVASPVIVSTAEDIEADIQFSATDDDLDPLTYQIVTQPDHGTLSGEHPNVVYTPAVNYNGTDSFTYKANDGRSDSNIETVTITVTPVNDAPVAVSDTYTTNEENDLSIPTPGIVANDSDIDDSSIDAILVDSPLNGDLTLNADGSFVYSPALNYNGTDSFTYKVSDGVLESQVTSVSITVNPVNDSPAAVNQTLDISEDNSVSITLSGTDVDNDTLTFNVTADPQHGTLQGSAPELTYTPEQNYSGSDAFSFSVTDGNGGTSSGSISIEVAAVNDAPQSLNDSFAVHVGTVLNVSAPGVLGNDSDIENQALLASLVSGPSNGVLTLNPDGSFSYTPNENFSGQDSFTYKANDGTLDSAIATVNINVTVIPVAHQQSVETTEDTDKAITLTGSDQFGNPITYTLLTHPTNGLLIGSAPNLTYSPDTDFSGSDSFTFKVNNGMEDSAPGTVNISVTPVNDSPVAVNDSVVTNEDTPVTTHNLVSNDTDIENDELSIVSFTQPSNGTLSNNGDQTFTYTPSANFNGSDSFTYIVNDGAQDSQPATVTITVNAVNDLPVADAQSVLTAADTPVDITVTGSDIEGDSFTFELVDSPLNGLLSGTLPNITYTPNQGVYGDDSFSFRLKEGELYSEPAIVSIRVKTPIPEASLTGSKTLVNANGLVVLSWSTQYANQSVTLTPGAGSVSETGSMDVYPSDTTTYTLTASGEGGTTTKTFTVEVDSQPPQVVAFDPPENGMVNAETLETGIRVTFSDNTGIASLTLFQIDGETETDVTGAAVINGNVITFDITGLAQGTHQYKLVIVDTAGNETIQYLSFTIDTVPPVTVASVDSGSFTQPFTVNLTCSEEATIFYSTDGSPPFEGGPNTIAASAPITGLEIDKSLNLQFYAKDLFGNIEQVQSKVYLLGALPESVTLDSVIFNDPDVAVAWTGTSGINGYRIYRALSPVDLSILQSSRNGGYAPPERLRYTSSDISSGTTTYSDSSILPGMTYYYGVTVVDQDDAESVISNIISVEIPASTLAANKDEAINRALGWLEFNQDKTGFWGNNENSRLRSTSQVLSAYDKAGKYDLNTAYALFYLRGQAANNNEYLARKILALSNYDQNVDIFVNKLVSRAYFYNESYNGWAIDNHYLMDAFDTVLAVKALAKHSQSLYSLSNPCVQLKQNANIESETADRFGWTRKGKESVYVSSLVYNMLDSFYSSQAPVLDSSWITGAQAPDGSFGNGLIDTSAVLLWNDSLSDVQRQSAVDYIVSMQTASGSWSDDPYITGLCLEALLK